MSLVNSERDHRREGGRILNPSPELAARRREQQAHERAHAARSTMDGWSASLGAPDVQRAAFDVALGDLHDGVACANHEVWGDPLPAHLPGGGVQLRARMAGQAPADDVHATAARGTEGAGGALPFLEQIQASFGRHDVGGVQAHTGGAAREASAALGAHAFARGNHVAFGGAPDLFTAAHEAAHVVQQRAGVALRSGVGESGDVYERHADAVADLVVRGRSAEGLLDRMAGGGGGGGAPVQLREKKGPEEDEHDRAAKKAAATAKRVEAAEAKGPSKHADDGGAEKKGAAEHAYADAAEKKGPSKHADIGAEKKGPSKYADIGAEKKGPSKHAEAAEKKVAKAEAPPAVAKKEAERGPSEDTAHALVDGAAGSGGAGAMAGHEGPVEVHPDHPAAVAAEVMGELSLSIATHAAEIRLYRSQLDAGTAVAAADINALLSAIEADAERLVGARDAMAEAGLTTVADGFESQLLDQRNACEELRDRGDAMAEEKDPADGALWKRGDGLCGALEHNVEDREGRIDVVRGQVAKGDPEAQGDIDALVGEIEADRDELAQHRAALDENGHAERAAALDAALERQLSAVADLLAGSFDEVGQDENDVQLDVDGSRAAAPANAPAIAARGAQGAGGPLPFRERIQASFGRHDVSGVRAHTDGAAQAASAALGARAYASGDHVAFGGAPDLHTAAHEAAHVVQQRAGVALKGGVGAEGDVYERHADAVADLVVRGEPAEGLLDRMAGPGAARAGEGVQLKREKREHTAEERAQMAQGRLHLEALRASQREVEKQLRKVERRAKKKGAELKAIDSELAALESWCAKDVAKFYGDELTRSGYLELKERTGEDARATIYGPSRERLERIRALRASLEAPMREQDFTARAETTEPEELEKKKQKGAELAADAEKLIAELTRSLDQVKQRVEAGDPRVDDEHRAGEISLRARSRIFLLEQLDLHVQQAVGTAALDGFVSRLTAISQEADALAPRAKRGDIPEGGHLERRSETWEDGKFKGSQEAWRTPSARGSSGRAPAPATKPGGERAQVEPAADDAETVERESAEEESKATA